jgi:hypothetical protein
VYAAVAVGAVGPRDRQTAAQQPTGREIEPDPNGGKECGIEPDPQTDSGSQIVGQLTTHESAEQSRDHTLKSKEALITGTTVEERQDWRGSEDGQDHARESNDNRRAKINEKKDDRPYHGALLRHHADDVSRFEQRPIVRD